MMTELRRDLPPLPKRMRGLALDHRGFPVPWFVAWIDGKPDFRVVDTPKLAQAVKKNLCWLCGQPKGVHQAFVIGPMCAINRTISEPSSHLECAEFAVKACPFLTQPRMRRNEKDIPDETMSAAGIHLERNPGAVCIWVTNSFRLIHVDKGVLFKLGDPEHVSWYCEGRPATRAEVLHSMNTGLPVLENMASQDGPDAVALLRKFIDRIEPLLPKAA